MFAYLKFNVTMLKSICRLISLSIFKPVVSAMRPSIDKVWNVQEFQTPANEAWLQPYTEKSDQRYISRIKPSTLPIIWMNFFHAFTAPKSKFKDFITCVERKFEVEEFKGKYSPVLLGLRVSSSLKEDQKRQCLVLTGADSDWVTHFVSDCERRVLCGASWLNLEKRDKNVDVPYINEIAFLARDNFDPENSAEILRTKEMAVSILERIRLFLKVLPMGSQIAVPREQYREEEFGENDLNSNSTTKKKCIGPEDSICITEKKEKLVFEQPKGEWAKFQKILTNLIALLSENTLSGGSSNYMVKRIPGFKNLNLISASCWTKGCAFEKGCFFYDREFDEQMNSNIVPHFPDPNLYRCEVNDVWMYEKFDEFEYSPIEPKKYVDEKYRAKNYEEYIKKETAAEDFNVQINNRKKERDIQKENEFRIPPSWCGRHAFPYTEKSRESFHPHVNNEAYLVANYAAEEWWDEIKIFFGFKNIPIEELNISWLEFRNAIALACDLERQEDSSTAYNDYDQVGAHPVMYSRNIDESNLHSPTSATITIANKTYKIPNSKNVPQELLWFLNTSEKSIARLTLEHSVSDRLAGGHGYYRIYGPVLDNSVEFPLISKNAQNKLSTSDKNINVGRKKKVLLEISSSCSDLGLDTNPKSPVMGARTYLSYVQTGLKARAESLRLWQNSERFDEIHIIDIVPGLRWDGMTCGIGMPAWPEFECDNGIISDAHELDSSKSKKVCWTLHQGLQTDPYFLESVRSKICGEHPNINGDTVVLNSDVEKHYKSDNNSLCGADVIIVDDGSLISNDIKSSFSYLWKNVLKPGGWFFIEEAAENSYNERYGAVNPKNFTMQTPGSASYFLTRELQNNDLFDVWESYWQWNIGAFRKKPPDITD